jgi:CRP-like cAMP-binding protein
METLKDLIINHHFFKKLSPDFLPALASAASFAEYKPQQLIFEEGTEASRFYLIHWGCVGLEAHVPNRRPVTIQRIGIGEALGWSWFFPPYTWRFTARTLDSTEIIAFDAAALRSHADKNHDFGYDLSIRMGRVMQDRLQATRGLLVDCLV